MSAYRTAIELTVRTIEERGRRFRNLVICVATLALVVIAWSLITRSPEPLIGIIILLPLCGLFFVIDNYELDAWRAELLEGWIMQSLDLAAFSAAIRANPLLPKGTTEGMLATLPSVGDLVEEQQITRAARQTMAAEVILRHRLASHALALRTAAGALAAAALIAAVVTGSQNPLWALLGLILLPATEAWMNRRHLIGRSDSTIPTSPPAR